MVLKQRKTVLIVSALLTAQMVMQEAVQAFEEVSQPEVQITETAQEGELVSQSDGDDIWTETYTYVSDTNTPHAFAETVEKQGDWYAMKDVEYQVTELTTQLIQKSEAMWAYASYEPEQEIEEAGIHYTLTSLSKDEWMQTDYLCVESICRDHLSRLYSVQRTLYRKQLPCSFSIFVALVF